MALMYGSLSSVCEFVCELCGSIVVGGRLELVRRRPMTPWSPLGANQVIGKLVKSKITSEVVSRACFAPPTLSFRLFRERGRHSQS